MSKYDTDLDYVILDIDISREELKEIEAEADKIISEKNFIRIDIRNLFSDTLVDICKEEALTDYFISEEDKKEAERLINWGLS